MSGLTEFCAWSMDDALAITYLRDVTNILAQYSWIYKERNTDIFIHNVLEKIPEKWNEALAALSAEDLNQLPFSFVKANWPTSLKEFVKQCQYLGQFRFPSRNLQDAKENSKGSHYMASKVASKKQYEIEIMSHLIHKVCQDLNCHVVLDIGSGLGYLDQVLHHRFGLKCIGLDSSSKYTLAAKDRIKKDPCVNSMHHHTMTVTNSEQCLRDLKTLVSSDGNFKCCCNVVEKVFEGNKKASTVMVGLHSCGNLTQDMMKLFCQIEELAALICVGCCYHKINLAEFPMSKATESVVSATSKKYANWFPCVSGLRLAAHGTRSHSINSSKQSHLEKSMLYRALFENYIRTENIIWHQPKRHIRSSDLPHFETYCRNMLKNHPLDADEKSLKRLMNLYSDKEYLFPRVRILLILQMMLQPLWEGFVTVDRMLYFRENSISTEVLAMWDDSKSSRNLALCAYKR